MDINGDGVSKREKNIRMNNNATGTISTPHSPISSKVTCRSHTLLSENI
jgi:hypothetical protein